MNKVNNRDAALGMMCHLAAFAGLVLPLANIAGPFIIWFARGKKSEFVDYHGKESMNFQISFTILYLLLVILSFVLAFDDVIIFAGGILGIFGVLFCFMQVIKAAAFAKRGERSRYPLTIRMIKVRPRK